MKNNIIHITLFIFLLFVLASGCISNNSGISSESYIRRDLIDIFKNKNYYTESVVGWIKMGEKMCTYGSSCDYLKSNTKCVNGVCYRKHMWLRIYLKQNDYVFGYNYPENSYIDIESTTGFIIHPDEYGVDYLEN